MVTGDSAEHLEEGQPRSIQDKLDSRQAGSRGMVEKGCGGQWETAGLTQMGGCKGQKGSDTFPVEFLLTSVNWSTSLGVWIILRRGLPSSCCLGAEHI